MTETAKRRPQTASEELANSLCHGVGFLVAAAGTPILIGAAAGSGSRYAVFGATVFAATAMLLYLASALYHGLPEGRGKRFFMGLDYAAIYLLIAGSYTPVTLGVLRGPLGWTLFGVIWALAIFGIVSRFSGRLRCPRMTTLLYLGMGWLAVVALHELWTAGPADGLFWLVAGGIAYTAGVAFFATDHRVRYFHFVWHIFVLAGTACHFVAMFHYVA